jgi:hypothetical protein
MSLFGEGVHISLDHRERTLKAMQVLIGDRKLTEGTGWPELFDDLSPERAEQLRELYDALPDRGRIEYDRRYGRPGEI